MNIKVLKNSITSKVGRQILITQKHSPVLLFGVGTVGFVATVVLASRATLKMDEVLKEAEENENKIAHAIRLKAEGRVDDGDYTAEDVLKDKNLNRVKTAIKIVQLYAPAVFVGVVSVGCLTGSHIILTRRNAALTAAYAAVEKGFKDYRARVVKEYGEDKDQEFRFGVVEKEIAVETDEGIAVKTVRDLDKKSLPSIYARIFDKTTSREWSPEHSYNQMFVRSNQNYANDLLNGRGHVFLNEVYDMLGMERTKAGAVVGWVRDNPRGGDNGIDFGVLRGDTYMGQQFINGNEKSVVLDFNVDGIVYDLLGDGEE